MDFNPLCNSSLKFGSYTLNSNNNNWNRILGQIAWGCDQHGDQTNVIKMHNTDIRTAEIEG